MKSVQSIEANRKPKIGDKISTWFSDHPSGCSTVLAVEKYTGKYPRDFNWIVTVTAPRTRSGQIQLAL